MGFENVYTHVITITINTQDIFITSKIYLMLFAVSLYCPGPKQPLICFVSRNISIFCFRISCKQDSTTSTFLCAAFYFCSASYVFRFIHILCIKVCYLLLLSSFPSYRFLFLCSSVAGCWNCFQFGAIKKNCYKHLVISLCVAISFGQIPRSRISDSMVNSI